MDRELSEILMDVAIIAASQKMPQKSRNITAALCATMQEKSGVWVIQGLCNMHIGDFEQAEKDLRDHALKLDPQNHRAKAFLGLCLQMMNRDEEATPLLHQVIVEGDEIAGEFARDLLDELDLPETEPQAAPTMAIFA